MVVPGPIGLFRREALDRVQADKEGSDDSEGQEVRGPFSPLTFAEDFHLSLSMLALGYRVERLRRVRIINIDLGALPPGEWRYLSEAEVAGLSVPAIRSSAAPVPTRHPSIDGPSPSASPDPAPLPRTIEKNPRPGWSNKGGRKAHPRSSTRR